MALAELICIHEGSHCNQAYVEGSRRLHIYLASVSFTDLTGALLKGSSL
jgi:hypothetical protein